MAEDEKRPDLDEKTLIVKDGKFTYLGTEYSVKDIEIERSSDGRMVMILPVKLENIKVDFSLNLEPSDEEL